MANRTDPLAATVHGTNPQNLIEQIVRSRIYDCQYWKQHCFGLTAESLLDKAVDLRAVGGTFGGARKPAEFLCLVLKLLQIQPDKEIIIEYIKNEDYKYVRVLGAFYLRLVGKPLEVYQYLEPLYNDYRKIRERKLDGTFGLTHVDEAVHDMLHRDHLFDVALPRIPHRLAYQALPCAAVDENNIMVTGVLGTNNRFTLERLGQLDPRMSVLDNDFDELHNAQAALDAEAAMEADPAGDADVDANDVVNNQADREAEERARERAEERAREKWRDRDRKDRRRGRSPSPPGRLPSPPRDGGRHREELPGPPPRDRDRDYDRSGRDRDRDYDRDREGADRGRTRDSGRDDRDRDRKRRSRSRSRDRDRSKRERGREDRRDGGEVDDVDEQNELRAKLGMKPLRR